MDVRPSAHPVRLGAGCALGCTEVARLNLGQEELRQQRDGTRVSPGEALLLASAPVKAKNCNIILKAGIVLVCVNVCTGFHGRVGGAFMPNSTKRRRLLSHLVAALARHTRPQSPS